MYPLVRTTKVSDETFTVTTLIGTCFRPIAAGSTDVSCTKINPGASAELFRVVVVVTWAPGKAGLCGGAATCTYRVTGLIDPTVDPNWNLTAKPVAYDDNISVAVGSGATFSDILANDVIGAVTSNPTTITSPPTMGSVTVRGSGTNMGAIDYTAPTNASGIATFSYRLRDQAGRTSNEGIVTVKVAPKAVNDSGTGVKNTTGTFDVLANDVGTFGTTSTVTIAPAVSGASVVGTQIQYKSTTTGTKTIKYTVTDPTSNVSNEATLTVVVKNSAPPVATDLAVTVPYTAKLASTTNLNILALTGNPSTYSIVMAATPVPSPGTVTLSGPANVATFNQPAAMLPGTYTAKFQVKNLDGDLTALATYTITVAQPVAVADAYSVKKSSASTFTVGTNDLPSATDWNNLLTVTTSNVTCGSVAVSASDGKSGKVVFSAPKTVPAGGSCSFDYVISAVSGGGITSNKVTVTVTVTP